MTRINLIDRASRILPFEDADVASVIAASFERLGILIHRQSRLKALRVVGGKVEYTLTNAAGVDEIFRVERALVSVGRVPNVESLRLDRAGVEIDAVGKLVGDGVSTSQPHIFAAGDVSMDVALVNVAELEGRHAVERMFGLNPPPIRYSALSSIMFLRPEVASVGLNEQRAKELGIPYRVAVVSNALIARNIAMRATHGFVKLLAEPAPGDRILGLRVVGPQASSAVQGVAYLIDRGVALDAIDHGVHPHPAITEGVQECARILLGRSILKPAAFGAELLRSEAN
jgi:dihydrolipoamide dehydrogenase